eukprot:CAMPEP_0184864678 /NCGR_PEP_ID=MMETSP0580-20130426/15813_1 /TAXON_ID=1118495 /ORGANISM="Dactyliosolen fragilissimus" /LENGTH=565 /DNA_ID=CAMNT_0027363577 /DNA_START=379 /DNA_END=2073 /DNA_ORIENTATION=+
MTTPWRKQTSETEDLACSSFVENNIHSPLQNQNRHEDTAVRELNEDGEIVPPRIISCDIAKEKEASTHCKDVPICRPDPSQSKHRKEESQGCQNGVSNASDTKDDNLNILEIIRNFTIKLLLGPGEDFDFDSHTNTVTMIDVSDDPKDSLEVNVEIDADKSNDDINACDFNLSYDDSEDLVSYDSEHDKSFDENNSSDYNNISSFDLDSPLSQSQIQTQWSKSCNEDVMSAEFLNTNEDQLTGSHGHDHVDVSSSMVQEQNFQCDDKSEVNEMMQRENIMSSKGKISHTYPTLEHVAYESDLRVNFRKLRWAILCGKSNFLTERFYSRTLNYQRIKCSPWTKHDNLIGHLPRTTKGDACPVSNTIDGDEDEGEDDNFLDSDHKSIKEESKKNNFLHEVSNDTQNDVLTLSSTLSSSSSKLASLSTAREDFPYSSFVGAQRNFQYLLPRSNFVPPNMAYETSTILHYDDVCFAYESITKTPDVPYGNCFVAKTRVVVTQIDSEISRVVCSSETDFDCIHLESFKDNTQKKKRRLPIMHRQISSAIRSGCTEFFFSYGDAVENFVHN